MRNTPTVIALVTLLLAGTGWAQESDPASEIAEEWTGEQALRELRQARLDVLMGTIAEEMHTIRNTQNRKERQALMSTHRENMREAMGLMREMGGTRMREVMAEHAGPGPAPTADSDQPKRKYRGISLTRPLEQLSTSRRLADLENRLDMMQVMMESMMDEYANN